MVFTDVSHEVAMEEALRDSRARAARERMNAAEAERARWARELHDETLQGLAALHVQLASRVRPSTVEEMGLSACAGPRSRSRARWTSSAA